MSWFARSVANTLNLDEDEHDDHTNESMLTNNSDTQIDDSSLGRGVKEDLSELTETLTRNFWGVASFLAPPPPSSSSSESSPAGSDPDESNSAVIPTIRGDLADIGGRFRSGISKLSNNMAAVSEITTKLATNFLQLGEEEEGRDYYDFSDRGGAVGVTDDVVGFVRDIAMHPETWLDFPLPGNEDDEDFDMSDAQQEHALAVERLAPRLAALRMELCPGYMSEACFWMIYFVLLPPRLVQHDAEVLLTPQIVKARQQLMQNIKNDTPSNIEQVLSSRDTSYIQKDMKSPVEESLTGPSATQLESVPSEASTLNSYPVAADFETEKHPISSTEIQIVDKSVIKEENVFQDKKQNLQLSSLSNVDGETDEDEADDWLKEESLGPAGSSEKTIHVDNDEDVSFSDLEEDDGDVPTNYNASAKNRQDWVQLSRDSPASAKNTHEPEGTDWLDLDEIEVT